MKKSYLMIAATATMLAACSSNDTFKDVDTQDVPISFEEALNKATRAAITDESSLQTAGGFVVYGYNTSTKTNSEYDWANANVTTVFNNVAVTYANSKWTPNVTRFWNKNASYNFYAIAPANSTARAKYGIKTGTGATDLKFTITGAESALFGNSQDYLIDRDGAKGVTYATSTNGTVGIDFHHVMAKVQVKLKSTLTPGNTDAGVATAATITVTSLVMSGWNQNTGNFEQNLVATPTTLQKDEWTLNTANTTAGSATLIPSTTTGNDAQTNIVLTCGSSTTTDVTDWWIMVPQEITSGNLTFTLTYTYVNDNGTPDNANDDYTETFTDQTATITTANDAPIIWGTDSHTTYILDVKPAAIDFSVEICGFGHNEAGYATKPETPIEVN